MIDTQTNIIQLPSADFWQGDNRRARGERYLVFALAGTTYGVPLTHVREVGRLPPVTMLPNAPPWLLGAANLRGEILSVVDLAAFLELGQMRLPAEAFLLACRTGGMEVGLVVESVRDIRELPEAAIRPNVGSVPGRAARYLAGVHTGDGAPTLILDLPRLFQSAEFRRFE